MSEHTQAIADTYQQLFSLQCKVMKSLSDMKVDLKWTDKVDDAFTEVLDTIIDVLLEFDPALIPDDGL